MSVAQCRWLALSVLGLGTCAAIPFSRNPDAVVPAAPANVSRQSSLSEGGNLTLQVSSASAATRVESFTLATPNSARPSQEAAARTLTSIPTLDPAPPELPPSYVPAVPGRVAVVIADPERNNPSVKPVRPRGKAARETKQQKAAVPDRVASTTSSDRPDGATGNRAEPRPPSTPSRIRRLPPVEPVAEVVQFRTLRHRVQDGDSLEALAARYLGSADRADELFQANRGVLPSPDLLPIGVELCISVQSPGTPPPAVPPLPSTGGTNVAQRTDLVPLSPQERAFLQARAPQL